MKYFAVNNYILLLIIIGFISLLFGQYKINKRSIFRIILILTTIINILNYIKSEYITSSLEYIFQTLIYLIYPIGILLLIFILVNNKKYKYLYLLIIINDLIVISLSLFDKNLKLISNYLFLSSIIYIIILIIVIISKLKNKNNIKIIIHIIFIVLTFIISIIIDINYNDIYLNNTILIFSIFQYFYLYVEDTKIDSLTKLLNRKTFYNDMKEYDSSITAIISIDMNGLKYINDKYGHHEGDKSLKAVSKILKKNSNDNYKFYRVGGDEFICLCLNQNKKQVTTTMMDIKQKLINNNCSCSFGLQMRQKEKDLIMVYKQADGKMYNDKRGYYKKLNIKR